MICNLKSLSVALVAVLAMSAMAVSTASANITEFTSTPGAGIESKKDGIQKFTVTNQEVSCEIAEYNGEAPSEVFTELTVTPTYGECKTGLGIAATITGFGAGECDLVFRASGTGDLACAAGKEVTIDAGTCVVHVPPQNGLGKIIYTTVKTLNVDALTLHVELGGMKETHTDGFLCPFEGGGTTSTGVLEFTTELWATKPAGTKVPLTDHTLK